MKIKYRPLAALLALCLLFTACLGSASACNFFSYVSEDGDVVTGRTMDAMNEACIDKLTLRLMPAGMERVSNTQDPMTWTSRYNSVTAYSDTLSVDGMNEKGLVCALLFFSGANYGPLKEGKPVLGVHAVTQFMLDNFATVGEAVDFINAEKDNFTIAAGIDNPLLGEIAFGTHWALSDATGDNCVIEYIDGEPVIYRFTGENMALTNDPPYSDHLAILQYARQKDLKANIPGSGLAEDRFLRMHAWMDSMRKGAFEPSMDELVQPNKTWQLRAMARSLTDALTTPYHMDNSGNTHNSSTLWKLVCDPQNRWLCLMHVKSFSEVILELDKLDFSRGILELNMHEGNTFLGDVTEKFVPMEKPFAFGEATISPWNNYDPANKQEVVRQRIEKFGY